MATCIALLRGINVGKARRVPMEDLRQLLLGLGYTGVRTLLNSGNAVFVAPAPAGVKTGVRTTAGAEAAAPAAVVAGHAQDIERALLDRFGLEVPVIVKSTAQWDAIVRDSPFAASSDDASRQFVALARDAQALSELKAIERLVQPPETFTVGRHAAYLHCASGVLESRAGAALVGKAGQAVTTRNWATTLKLHALCASPAADAAEVAASAHVPAPPVAAVPVPVPVLEPVLEPVPEPAGYSGTPLFKKLGLSDGTRLAVLGSPLLTGQGDAAPGPDAYQALIGPWPDGVERSDRVGPSTTLVHLFATQRTLLADQLQTLRARLDPEAAVWVSWPKKASKVRTDITEDVIREIALPLGFVDIKVCAVSAVWSGLKLVVRKELRGLRTS
jgi:uncharacterized protein (DUF1697 family)